MSQEDNKTKKLSQEEARISGAAKRFLRQISIAVKNISTFGENHPLLAGNVENACNLLKSILASKESVTFTFAEGACLIEDMNLKDIDLKTYPFLTVARECGITSLTFMQGLPEEELKRLLKVVAGGPKTMKSAGGLAAFIKNNDIAHIKADEVIFIKVSKKEEKEREAKKHLESFLVINYLMGKSAASKDDIESIVGETTMNPDRMGKILSGMAGSGYGFASSDGASLMPGAGQGIEFVKEGIGKIATHIKTTGGESNEDVKKHIGRLIMSLDPGVRDEILRSNISASGISDDIVKDIVRELSSEVVVGLIVSDVVDKGSSVTRTRRLIERLMPEPARRSRTFPLIETKLLQKGVLQKVCGQLLEGKFWSDMDSDERIKNILDEPPIFCVEIGIADVIAELVEDLLADKKFDAVPKIVDKIFENFRSDDEDFKTRLARDLEKIYTPLSEFKEYPYKERLIAKIADEFKSTKEGPVRERLVKLFAGSIKSCLSNGWYHLLPVLFGDGGYQAARRDIAGEISADELFNKMLSDDKLDKTIVRNVAREMGEDASLALRNILMSMSSNDFDSYKKRYGIAMILKDLGEAAEGIFIRELSSDKHDVVKNSLETLSEIGNSGAIPEVEKLLGHKDIEIRNRAATTLKRIKQRAEVSRTE